MVWLVIILYRLILPLTMLVMPWWGSVLSIFGDNFDMVITDFFNLEDYSNYNLIDKALDSYMYLFMGFLAWKWRHQFARKLVLSLLAFRLTGVGVFTFLSGWRPATDWRQVLVMFPDFFVFAFMYVLMRQRIAHKPAFATRRETIIALSTIFVLKMLQEYMLHVAQYPLYVQAKAAMLDPIGLRF